MYIRLEGLILDNMEITYFYFETDCCAFSHKVNVYGGCSVNFISEITERISMKSGNPLQGIEQM
jgi:hypothetical protein